MTWFFYPMLGAAILILVLSLAMRRRRRLAEAKRAFGATLVACRSLHLLLGHLQQHRGMSSAWLSGNQSFAGQLDAKAREINALLASLRPLAICEGKSSHPCLTLNELSLFQLHWERLREGLAALSVEQSIARHSHLIEQLLQWLAAFGEARVEPLLQADGNSAVRNYASRLPALTECLGQARAVGMHVAARQACSAVARVRLMFLVARAEALLNQATEGVPRGRCSETAAIAVQQMARLVRTRMLVSSGISVTVPEYFGIATQAIDSVFAWISEIGEGLAAERQPDGADAMATYAAAV